MNHIFLLLHHEFYVFHSTPTLDYMFFNMQQLKDNLKRHGCTIFYSTKELKQASRYEAYLRGLIINQNRLSHKIHFFCEPQETVVNLLFLHLR